MGGGGSCWGRGAGEGPHRPRVAGLPLRLASSPIGGLHGTENAAVGVSGLDGPLDEAVLVEPTDDAVFRQERDVGCVGWGPDPDILRPTCLSPQAPHRPRPLPCGPPCVPFSSLAASLGRDPCADLVQTRAASSRSPPRPAVPQEGPVASPGRPAGRAPGQVEGQLVQLLRVRLGGLHQAHLAACRGEGPHLLQQRRPGPVQVCSEALIFLGGAGGRV